MIVKMALHGLKSSGYAFRSILAKVTCDMGYRPSKDDPDANLKLSTKLIGFRCHMKLLAHSNDALSISYKIIESTEGIRLVFKLKVNKKAIPDVCVERGIA